MPRPTRLSPPATTAVSAHSSSEIFAATASLVPTEVATSAPSTDAIVMS